MKKLLSATSAAALVVGLVGTAFANPTVKDSYDVYDLVDIYFYDEIEDNRDVYVESYNAAVLSENYQYGEVYYPDIYIYEYRSGDVNSGSIDMDGSMEDAAGQFSYVVNTGWQNVNQAAASIAANADVTFDSD